jgi:hypothetical protein
MLIDLPLIIFGFMGMVLGMALVYAAVFLIVVSIARLIWGDYDSDVSDTVPGLYGTVLNSDSNVRSDEGS